jgi:hypothetical protein
MTPLVIGALLAVAAMVWVIAPIFSEPTSDALREAATRDMRAQKPSQAAADAAEEAIRKWRQPEK